jgi:hypothetical protein
LLVATLSSCRILYHEQSERIEFRIFSLWQPAILLFWYELR